jgi:hypothetical protein
MEFWGRHMPAWMLLRSSVDWYLDPQGEHRLAACTEDADRCPRPRSHPLQVFVDYVVPRREGVAVHPVDQ